MSATTDPAASVECRESVRRRRAARPRGAKQLDSTALIYLVLVGVIIVSAVLTAVEGRNFFSQGNIWAVLTAMSVLGLISIGQTLVILVGSLDLSVPYVVSLATVIAAGGMKGLDCNLPAAVFNTLGCARWSASRWGARQRVHVHGFIASLGVGLIVSGYLATNYQGSHGDAAPALEAVGRSGIAAGIPTAFLVLLAGGPPGDADAALHAAGSPHLRHRRQPGGRPHVGRAHVLPVIAGPRAVLGARRHRRTAAALAHRRRVADDRVAGPLRPAVDRGGRARRHPAVRRQGERGRHDRRRRDLRGHRQRHGCHAGQPVPQGLRPRPGHRARRRRLRPPQRRTPSAPLRRATGPRCPSPARTRRRRPHEHRDLQPRGLTRPAVRSRSPRARCRSGSSAAR